MEMFPRRNQIFLPSVSMLLLLIVGKPLVCLITKHGMMNLPSLFDVNVTASSTISIGVVRHRIYLTSSLKISEDT